MDDNYAAGNFATITPFNLTPPVPVPEPTTALAALLAPTIPDTCEGEEVFVSFRECNMVTATATETIFELTFTVSVVPTSGNSPDAVPSNADGTKTTTVSRRIVVNNQSLGREATENIAAKKSVYVESVQAKKAKEQQAKRIRELAGIPHKGNYV